ncbi:hypothetical protein M8C21_006374 [Ambrosia artemisiifolia]|uniref:Uncharacterized protein n=1 Tax=Ambrosia artemisiifolia TaxID=4212 RepID=A0AAD5CYK1_AMBAR|nr:hypothetical protein M8C21_006374 [Ambrosia artemisiifolia]
MPWMFGLLANLIKDFCVVIRQKENLHLFATRKLTERGTKVAAVVSRMGRLIPYCYIDLPTLTEKDKEIAENESAQQQQHMNLMPGSSSYHDLGPQQSFNGLSELQPNNNYCCQDQTPVGAMSVTLTEYNYCKPCTHFKKNCKRYKRTTNMIGTTSGDGDDVDSNRLQVFVASTDFSFVRREREREIVNVSDGGGAVATGYRHVPCFLLFETKSGHGGGCGGQVPVIYQLIPSNVVLYPIEHFFGTATYLVRLKGIEFIPSFTSI